LEEILEDDLITSDPVVICRARCCFRRFVGVLVSWFGFQDFSRLGVGSGEQTDEASATDQREDLCTPSWVVVAGELVRGRGAQMVLRMNG
jgi:hypothetical protein